MKKFIKKFLGIEELSIIVRDANRSHKEAIVDLQHLNNDLDKRIKLLEQDNKELIEFICAIFPRYRFMNNAIRINHKFMKNLRDLPDGIGIWELINKKDKEVEEEIKQCIDKNELNIESNCLKVSEELFNKLINEKFPVPEEFKEEQIQDSKDLGEQ